MEVLTINHILVNGSPIYTEKRRHHEEGGLSSLCHLWALDIFPSTLISFRNVYWPNHTKLGSIHFWIKWDLEKWGYYTPEATEDNLPLILPSSQERTSIRKSGKFFGKICTKELKMKKIVRGYFISLRKLQLFSVSWRDVIMTVDTSLIISENVSMKAKLAIKRYVKTDLVQW